MTDSPEAARKPEETGGAIRELAEDAVGFGMAELRMTRDLVVRPSAVLGAYEAHGNTGGGLYPRAFRYYLALNGVYLVLIALLGGFERMFASMPTEVLSWGARQAGKSQDAFNADLDQWMSLTALPVTALALAIPLYLLFRRWSGADPRTAFRQTFAFLGAYTLYGSPFALFVMLRPELMMWLNALTFVITPLLFVRMGRNRWWRTAGGAVLKTGLLLGSVLLVMLPAGVVLWSIALAGAIYGP